MHDRSGEGKRRPVLDVDHSASKIGRMTRPVILLAALMAASVQRIIADGGPMVPLTKEDIIEIYQVPVDTRPAYKFEWKSPTPVTYRLTLESQAKDGSWKASYSADETPTKHAWMTLLRDDGSTSIGPRPVSIRWGFENGDLTGWGSRDLVIDGEVQDNAVNPPGQPGVLFSVTTDKTRYRVRVEKVVANPPP